MKTCCPHKPELGLLFIRIALGLVFVVHGGMKFAAMDATIAFFAQLGLPAFMAWFVATVEVAGGLAMLAGMYVCIAGLLLAITMFVAIWLTKDLSKFAG